MDFFTGLATLAIGFYRAKRETDQEIRHNEAWFKLSLSIFGTALVVFLGAFGSAGLGALKLEYAPLTAFMFAVFTASGVTAAAILLLWKSSSQTKGIPIIALMGTEQKVLEGGFALTIPAEPNKTKGGK